MHCNPCPFLHSGQQCKAKLCLRFRVCIFQELQKRGHGERCVPLDRRSLGAGFWFGVERIFKLFAQLHAGRLLDMGVSVNQKIRTGVAGCSLHRFDIAARDHQLVGGAGMSQPVEDDAGELRVSVLPFEELFADQNGLHGLTIGQAEKHSAVVVAVWGAGLVFFQPFQPVFQFLPETKQGRDEIWALIDELTGLAEPAATED